jgi:hypothetical protein
LNLRPPEYGTGLPPTTYVQVTQKEHPPHYRSTLIVDAKEQNSEHNNISVLGKGALTEKLRKLYIEDLHNLYYYYLEFQKSND